MRGNVEKGQATKAPGRATPEGEVDDQRALRVLKTWVMLALLLLGVVALALQLAQKDINLEDPEVDPVEQ